jgi:Flp pilus assembly protein TadG
MNPFNAFHRLSARDGRRRMRGQGLVEFALIIPAFLLLIMILFDFGRVIYAQNAINNDAREGARAAIVDARFDLAKYDAIRAAAKRFSPLVSLTDSMVTGNPVTCPAGVADAYPGCFYPNGATAGLETEVNIRVTVPIITPIISQLIGGSFTLTAKSVNFIQCSGC